MPKIMVDLECMSDSAIQYILDKVIEVVRSEKMVKANIIIDRTCHE